MQKRDAKSPIEILLDEEEAREKKKRKKESKRIEGVVIGTIAGVSSSGAPLVDFAKNPKREPTLARAMCSIRAEDVGREVALLFEHGRADRPIAMGLMAESTPRVTSSGKIEMKRTPKRLVLEAEEEIVLRCGDASITLTRAGKVLLKGAYLSSRSSGVNRIVGGSVQIN